MRLMKAHQDNTYTVNIYREVNELVNVEAITVDMSEGKEYVQIRVTAKDSGIRYSIVNVQPLAENADDLWEMTLDPYRGYSVLAGLNYKKIADFIRKGYYEEFLHDYEFHVIPADLDYVDPDEYI